MKEGAREDKWEWVQIERIGFILGTRKKIFTVKVVRHWYRLLTKVVDASSLDEV